MARGDRESLRAFFCGCKRDPAGAVHGKTIRACAQGRQRDALAAVLDGQLQ